MAKRNTNSDNENKQTFDEVLPQAQATISQHLGRLGNAALIGGMATLTAAGALALATGLAPTALGTLTVGLGVNWFTQLIWELRQKADPKRNAANEASLIHEAARQIEANLTDGALGKTFEQLHLVGAALHAVQQDQAAQRKLIEQLLAYKLATPEQIKAEGNRVNISVGSGGINHSAVIAIGGDNHGHIEITLAGERMDVGPQVAVYKRHLAQRVSVVDLLPVNSQNADDPDRIGLADVYTPLFAVAPQRQPMDLADGERGEKSDPTANAFVRLLNDHPRAVILGDPGCGKSTVLNYLALGLCGLLQDAPEFAQQWTHGPMLPIRIILREFARAADFNQADGTGLLRYACAQLNTPQTPDLGARLSDYLQTHGAVFLLDGLDEVPASQRRDLKTRIECLVQDYPRCRFVVTCRSYSYESERTQLHPQHPHALPFATFTVRALDANDMRRFVGTYFKQISLKRAEINADDHARRLSAALADRPRLRKMGSNPLLLSLMVLVQAYKGRLPKDRAALIGEVIESLLTKWKKEIYDDDASEDFAHDRRIRAAIDQRKEAFVEALCQIALDAHTNMAGSDDDDDGQTADIGREVLEHRLGTFFKPEIQEGLFNLESVWTYLSNRVGLLNYVGGDDAQFGAEAGVKRHTYKFPHRLIQEYLAAKAISDLGDPETVPDNLDKDYARWREVFALIALMPQSPQETLRHVNNLCPFSVSGSADEPPSTTAQARRALLAGQIWMDREVTDAQYGNTKIAESYERVRALQLWLMRAAELLPARERAEAGRTLAKLRGSDPRPEVNDVDHMVWCNVPKGDFVMGGDGDYDGKPKFVYTKLDQDYAISQYPITQSQFRQFVDDGGYGRKEFWGAAIAAERWDEVKGVRTRIFVEGEFRDGWATEPNDFGEPYSLGNHPVVGVSWYEMVAFCEWLSARCGETIRLPSEAEWEKAARGNLTPRPPLLPGEGEIASARAYPWGDEPDPNKANYNKSNIGNTSAVGCFPNGRALESGCEEMSGNVWEWTSTKWVGNYEGYDTKENNDSDGSDATRVLRGGAYFDFQVFVRGACRLDNNPLSGVDDYGFRVVRCAHSPSCR